MWVNMSFPGQHRRRHLGSRQRLSNSVLAVVNRPASVSPPCNSTHRNTHWSSIASLKSVNAETSSIFDDTSSDEGNGEGEPMTISLASAALFAAIAIVSE